MKSDHRRNGRHLINYPVVYTAMDSDGEIRTRGVGRALDLSPNGLMVETHEPIREERLRIRVTISDSETIAADGVLVYSILFGPKTYRTGIKLTGTDKAVADFISKLQHVKCMES